MAAASFPLVEIRSVANANNEWVALLLRAAEGGFDDVTLQAMFGAPDLLAAVAPLDCIVLLDSPAALTPPVLNVLPPNRVVLAVDAHSLAVEGAARRLAELQMEGYRVLLDGPLPAGIPQPAAMRGVSRDVTGDCDAPLPATLSALFGPHLARGVDTRQPRSGAARRRHHAAAPLDDVGAAGPRRRLARTRSPAETGPGPVLPFA
jgi:EAL and modified HD-GYP domain-containing signal transduction protein